MASTDGTHKTVHVFIPTREDTAQRDMHKRANSANGFYKYQKKMRLGKEFLSAEHDYVLFRGDSSTGRTQRMLGRDAKALNDGYERKFMDSKTPRLWRWRLARADAQDGGRAG